MKKYCCWMVAFLFVYTTLVTGQSSAKKIQKPGSFTEGILYSRSTFPGHVLHDSLRNLYHEKGGALERDKVIQALKKHQQSIKGGNEQEIKDAFFISGIMVMPIY